MKKILYLPKVLINITTTLLVLGVMTASSLLSLAQNSVIRSGHYVLQNMASGKVMGLPAGIEDYNGQELLQQIKTNDLLQQFDIEKSGTGQGYNLLLREQDLYLSVRAGTASPNTERLYMSENLDSTDVVEMRWDFRATTTRNVYTIHSLVPSSKPKTMGILSVSDPKIIYKELTNAQTQADLRYQWRLIYVLTDGAYLLQNVATKMVMNVGGNGKDNGSLVFQTERMDTTNNAQKFSLEQAEDGSFTLSPNSTKDKRFITKNTKKTAPLLGEQVWIANKLEGTQKWTLEPTDDNKQESNDLLYTIRSVDPTDFLGVSDLTDKKVLCGQFNQNDTRCQWRLIPVSERTYLKEGVYRISNVATGKVMSLDVDAIDNGTEVVQDSYIESKYQHFEVQIDDNINYNITPINSKGTKFLSVSSPQNSTASQLTITDKKNENTAWILDDVFKDNEEDADETYTIRSADPANNKLLSIVDEESPKIVQSTLSDAKAVNQPNSLWLFEEVFEYPYLKPGIYAIQNIKTGNVMTVQGGDTSDGTRIFQLPYAAKNNQIFEVTVFGSNTYRLRPLHLSTSYLSVLKPDNSEGAAVQIWNKNESAIQHFDIKKVGGIKSDNIFLVQNTFSNYYLGIESTVNTSNVLQLSSDIDEENPKNEIQWRFVPAKSYQTKALRYSTTDSTLLVSAEALNAATLREEGESQGVRVFPNPATNVFDVTITDFEPYEELKLTITGLTGTVVFKTDMGLNRTIKVDADQINLSVGVYVVNVFNENDKKRTQKIILMR